jgi:integrase
LTGSIEKCGKGSYRFVVFKGYDLDGKSIRHQETIHCKSKSEARTVLARYIAQIDL